ncbi:hypothetical protein EV360DRAFT_57692, partial [Lentinula raphanica]
QGLDPHQDTLVEILHVVLLGFLKYMWRDLVNQVKNQEELKKLLEIRLKSLNVDGLEISPIAGHTLVQYAGSLTGRDFRVIAQVAPFIIHDLKISNSCREAWLAISRLVPLIWQPTIDDIDDYIKTLEQEIDYFLLCVARWTTRWFNKPKFHILVHLALHIRRFGPAMLFATEAFESFNAVIRAKSVHSNRQAPSRDIAMAFAQGNRIRHLLNHTYTSLRAPGKSITKLAIRSFSADSTKWMTIGPGPSLLASSENTMVQYLGIQLKQPPAQTGTASSTQPIISFSATSTGSIFPFCDIFPESVRRTGKFHRCSSVVMANGVACKTGSFFVGRNAIGVLFIGKLLEVLVVERSVAALSQLASSILVQVIDTSIEASSYRMPRITFTNQYNIVDCNDMLCGVNVQHHCIGNKCSPTGARTAYQERAARGTEAVIEHHSLDDLVLNTCQMWSARLVQQFRIASPLLDTEHIINDSVRVEIDARKATRNLASHSQSSSDQQVGTSTGNARKASQLRFQLFTSHRE